MKYIIYCRKSTDEKDKQILSIESQIAELKEFAKREKLEIVDTLTEAKSAKIPGRLKFGEVLRRIEKGEIQGILSWHPDRLARNSIDGGRIIFLLDTGKLIDLKFPTFWFDNTPQGKFMLNIAFGQSKYYVDNLIENIKRGNRQKLRNGVWPSKAPLGYLNNPKTRGIDIDSEKSLIVKKAFELFIQGRKSFTDIDRFLASVGVTDGNGRELKNDVVKYMLTNKFYVGIMKYAGEYYQGTHQTFIDKELFEKVQKQVVKIEKPRGDGHNFPFVGIARCAECGGAITAEIHTKYYRGTDRTANYIYYHCTKKMGKYCSQAYIRQEEFESQFRKIVSDIAIPESVGNDWLSWLEEDKENEVKLSQETIFKLEEQTSEIDRKQNILLDSFLDQIVDPDTYKKKKNELFEQKLELQEKIALTKEKGSSWLEPLEEFIKSSINCGKIACVKNNSDELSSTGKNVGSNFFLNNRRLSVNYNLGYSALFSECGGRPPATMLATKSQSVVAEGLEPPTLRM
ncbi:MAG: Recombinase [Candidatus Curtissbacteria bacterium GW2011_GWC1_44_33]|uniref:Recombinase n=1 Tax=Candidatus Curtissbacteria bacterium GW2011_GWC1_44_33 TaxID=1618413 RepID=A0A0G1J687_9BACT|nr:MAG: Recombinase [Candidatus Curtissbacteria bacterium GW2011_GWC1_44_33]